MKIFEGLGNSKNMVFNVKKLFIVGVGLTYGEKAERTDASGISGRSSGFTPPKAGFRQRTCKHRHLSRAFETGFGPPRPKGVAWRKIRLFADSALTYAAQIT
jgi:hypothetical protein